MQVRNSALFLTPYLMDHPITGERLLTGKVLERSSRVAYIASEMSGIYADPDPMHLLNSMFGITVKGLHYFAVYLDSQRAGDAEILPRLGSLVRPARLMVIRSMAYTPEQFSNIFLRQFIERGEIPQPDNTVERAS